MVLTPVKVNKYILNDGVVLYEDGEMITRAAADALCSERGYAYNIVKAGISAQSKQKRSATSVMETSVFVGGREMLCYWFDSIDNYVDVVLNG